MQTSHRLGNGIEFMETLRNLIKIILPLFQIEVSHLKPFVFNGYTLLIYFGR